MFRYDKNGFVLASKKLLDGMKFQWSRTPDEITEVTQQQLKWLLNGLSIEQKKAHHEVKMSSETSSVKNALRSGFMPGWVEMTVKATSLVDEMNK